MKIHSIFESISGEAGPAIPQGAWTTFIRAQGCSAHCTYCDTKDSWDPNKGVEMSVGAIVANCFTRNVLITGGEPLEQWKALIPLLRLLRKHNHIIQIETNGIIWPLPTEPGVGYAVDIKCPCSGIHYKMKTPEEMAKQELPIGLDLKFVVQDEVDVEFVLPYVQKLSNTHPSVRFVFSPINASPGQDLIPFIVQELRGFVGPWVLDRVIFSLQIHKILNMP